MGLLIAFAAIAPMLGAAAVMDWRSRQRRRRIKSGPSAHTVTRAPVDLGLDIGDAVD
jgi:hypothetical protein